ncbi:uncharacterized protein TNIN_109241 [Trichonephila inaurata madagascariensis]|uniref:Uncharacterized protein n=1 Tax=Trichonephila inaurata madagascariensis TaxID=2747483 RepID=A0A8X6YFG0_9ARAC|nr:uncharacterized protein TNIN_109241 [Trichonephila inaurata madagascariensis]
MQLLFLISVGVLFGYVACDAECYQREAKECSKSLVSEIGSDLDRNLCNFQRKLFTCLKEVARECEMSFEPELRAVEFLSKQLCDTGSKLHQQYEEHKDCLIKSATNSKCSESIVNVFKDKTTERELVIAQAEVCKQLDTFSNCIAVDVKKVCGSNAEAFYNFVQGPSIRLQRKLCDEVIIPLSEKGEGSLHMDAPTVFRSLGLF